MVINFKKQPKACFKEHCFKLELAVTSEERTKGLMFRESLGDNEGMLFIFPEEELHSFWMKNTLISLDIIWLDKDGKAVFISKNTQPCQETHCLTINPYQKAKYVLEIKGGMSDKIGLEEGDKVNIKIEK